MSKWQPMNSSVVVIVSFGNKCQESGRAMDFGVSNIFTARWRHELGKYCIRRQQVTKLQTLHFILSNIYR